MSLYNTDGDMDFVYLDWMKDVVQASQKLVKCKGRYHAELNYRALEDLIKKEPKDND